MCFSLIPYLLVLSEDNLCKWFECRSGSESRLWHPNSISEKKFGRGFCQQKSMQN